MPKEYEGREHTWLKHRVLSDYVAAWAHKLGSAARHGKTRLWYVDCFAGPWKSRSQDLQDTSIHVGLEALEAAARTWKRHGYVIELGAVFVEKGSRAFVELNSYLSNRTTTVTTHPLQAEFAKAVPRIERIIGDDAAFVFVDPTGWKGVGMQHIAPLVARPRRDVLVNVMFDHVNRFKDDPRTFLRRQMQEFFGLGEAAFPPGLGEDELLSVYRSSLKATGQLEFAADLAVPHPLKERTKLRLVVAGHNREVIRLFRDVERRVIGEEAAPVRAHARRRDNETRTRQMELIATAAPTADSRYTARRDESLSHARKLMLEAVLKKPRPYGELWPVILEICHIAESDLKGLAVRLEKEEQILIQNRRRGERSVKDHHVIAPGREHA